MAERRMFAKTIIDSDAFLDMPLSAQALYFHLSMRADDDGFVNNPKKIQRMIGASDDDCKLLVLKRFILTFESGVIVIKHWKIHNYIQRDRYKETIYKKEKALLRVDENNAYTECIQVVSKMETQDRLELGKDRLELGKDIDIIGESQAIALSDDELSAEYSYSSGNDKKHKIDYEAFKTTYNENCTNLSKVTVLSDRRKKAIRDFCKQLTIDDFKNACIMANNSDFCTGSNDRGWKADFDFIVRVDKALSLIEGKYQGKTKQEEFSNPFLQYLYEQKNGR